MAQKGIDKRNLLIIFAAQQQQNNQFFKLKNNIIMTTIEFNTKLTSLQKNLEVFAKQLTGNEDDAKDLMQETFLKALIYKEKYVNHNNFKAWV